MSLDDIIEFDTKTLQNLVFTFNPKLCKCESLEELQKVLDKLTKDD